MKVTLRTQKILWGVFGALTVLALLALVDPVGRDDIARSQAAKILHSLRPTQRAIESRASNTLEGSGIGVAYSPDPAMINSAISEVFVLSNGAIVVRSTPHGHVMVMIPALDEGALTWRCVAGPAQDVPTACR